MKILNPILMENATVDSNPEIIEKNFSGLDFAGFISNSEPPRGTLVVVEGIDGAGKTTLVYQLARALSGIFEGYVVLTAEPSKYFRENLTILDFPPGILQSCTEKHCCSIALSRKIEALKLSLDHAIHLSQIVIPAMLCGKIVICDRWFWSSYCYQVERLAEVGEPESENIIQEIHKGWDLIPDATIYLRVPVEEALRRIAKRGESPHIYEQKDFLDRVSARYEKLAVKEKSFIPLDGTLSENVLLHQAMEIAMHRIIAKRER